MLDDADRYYEPEDDGRWCLDRCRWILDDETPRHYCPHCEELCCSSECLEEHVKACAYRTAKEGDQMPHDKKGKELKVGDKVKVEFTVTEIYPAADTCQIKLERSEPDEQVLMLYGQAKQTELIEPEPAVDEPASETVADA